MKPSERIAELWARKKNTIPLAFPIDDLNPILRAMFDYLDEEWERNNKKCGACKMKDGRMHTCSNFR